MKSLKFALLGAAMMAGLGATAAKAADPYVEPEVTPQEYQNMGWYLRGDLGWSFLEWSGGDDDSGLGVGGGVGYQWNRNFRSDVRVDWSGNYDVGDGADMSMTTVLGNGYFDFANDSMFTPYVGAGAGYGWTSGDNEKDGFAYSLMAGVSVNLSEHVALDAGYRYRQILSDGADPMDHSALAGVRFKF
ncbi:hypothetical protein BH10PSE7_BH10PSE7_45030 [soil metagenome]